MSEYRGNLTYVPTETGLEAIERLRFLASLPVPARGREARKRNLSIALLPTQLQWLYLGLQKEI